MDIKRLIKKSRNKNAFHNKGHIFISHYGKWLEGVEAHIKCRIDQDKFFIDITDGIHRAFIGTEKVGVWGGVPKNGYFLTSKQKNKKPY